MSVTGPNPEKMSKPDFSIRPQGTNAFTAKAHARPGDPLDGG